MVAVAEANACPYDYGDDFEVSVEASGPEIASVTFGYEKALTMIRAINFDESPVVDSRV